MTRLSLALCIAIAWTAPQVLAGTVTAMSKAKSLVKVDEGTPSGLTKGAKVCFYGDDGSRVGCGSVTKATESFSFVRVKSSAAMEKIKKGMTAKLVGGSKGSGSGDVTVASGGSDHRNNVKIGYVGSVLAPSTFNRITYNPPAVGSSDKQESLWKKESTATGSLIGAYLEGEFGIGQSMAMSIGVRYRLFSDFEAQTDYSQDFTQFVDVSQKASSLGLYSDFTFLDVAFSKSLFFRMGTGLDIDMSTVKFTAVQNSDSGESNQIATYKSSLNVVSLRLGSSLSFMIGPLGMITPGVNLLVPVAASGKASGTVTDPQSDTILTAGSAGANDDLKKAIDHKKASFGAEVYLAMFLAF